jgi:hypothetical protein
VDYRLKRVSQVSQLELARSGRRPLTGTWFTRQWSAPDVISSKASGMYHHNRFHSFIARSAAQQRLSASHSSV